MIPGSGFGGFSQKFFRCSETETENDMEVLQIVNFFEGFWQEVT